MKRLLLFAFSLLLLPKVFASNFKAEDWLLWYEKDIKLPYASSHTYFPPILLSVEGGKLTGITASPYSFKGDDPNDQLLIAVTDANHKTHLLIPNMKSVGFANKENGLLISDFSSENFTDGKINFKVYKANTDFNRQTIAARHAKNSKRKVAITKAANALPIPKPVLTQKWPITGSTDDNQDISTLINRSPWTVVQLYSDSCQFSQQAITLMNELHQSDNINVIGLAGHTGHTEFEQHLAKNNAQYPFMSFAGEYAKQALLNKLNSYHSPTYLILDDQQVLHEVLIGSEINNWLLTLNKS